MYDNIQIKHHDCMMYNLIFGLMHVILMQLNLYTFT